MNRLIVTIATFIELTIEIIMVVQIKEMMFVNKLEVLDINVNSVIRMIVTGNGVS